MSTHFHPRHPRIGRESQAQNSKTQRSDPLRLDSRFADNRKNALNYSKINTKLEIFSQPQRYILRSLPKPMARMVPFRLKERAHFLIEMVDRYLRLAESQPGRFGIGAHPWFMRCRIKP
jgi:hypothetical protein